MTQIPVETIEKIADLAQLKLTQDELSYYQTQFEKILSYMDQIKQIVDGHSSEWRPEFEIQETPERQDQAQESNVIDAVLAGAPKISGTSFQVPRILD